MFGLFCFNTPKMQFLDFESAPKTQNSREILQDHSHYVTIP